MSEEFPYPAPSALLWWVLCPDGEEYQSRVSRAEARALKSEADELCDCGQRPHRVGAELEDGRVVPPPATRSGSSGGPRLRPNKGLYRCGLCHRDGHVAPTCPYRELRRV